jgi:hypothetical protein
VHGGFDGIRHSFDIDLTHPERLVNDDMLRAPGKPLARPIEISE